MRAPEGAEVPGSYAAEITRLHPGCLQFLVGQSGSMNDAFAGRSAIRKADVAADAMNDLLRDVVVRCVQNFSEGPRNYGPEDGLSFAMVSAIHRLRLPYPLDRRRLVVAR